MVLTTSIFLDFLFANLTPPHAIFALYCFLANYIFLFSNFPNFCIKNKAGARLPSSHFFPTLQLPLTNQQWYHYGCVRCHLYHYHHSSLILALQIPSIIVINDKSFFMCVRRELCLAQELLWRFGLGEENPHIQVCLFPDRGYIRSSPLFHPFLFLFGIFHQHDLQIKYQQKLLSYTFSTKSHWGTPGISIWRSFRPPDFVFLPFEHSSHVTHTQVNIQSQQLAHLMSTSSYIYQYHHHHTTTFRVCVIFVKIGGLRAAEHWMLDSGHEKEETPVCTWRSLGEAAASSPVNHLPSNRRHDQQSVKDFFSLM